MPDIFSVAFPNLVDVANKKTSEATHKYNCIAWAFGDNRRFWWPGDRMYWPFSHVGMTEMEAFQKWFQIDGWQPTTIRTYEAGLEKVALYVINGRPTHASRLLPNGYWTSKLGREIDISHSFAELDGPAYGSVHSIYQKKL